MQTVLEREPHAKVGRQAQGRDELRASDLLAALRRFGGHTAPLTRPNVTRGRSNASRRDESGRHDRRELAASGDPLIKGAADLRPASRVGPLLAFVHLSSERTLEPVHQDSSFAEKQESHPALLLVVEAVAQTGEKTLQEQRWDEDALLVILEGVNPNTRHNRCALTSVVPRLIDAPICGSVCATASVQSGHPHPDRAGAPNQDESSTLGLSACPGGAGCRVR
jgi:hypothetical protein